MNNPRTLPHKTKKRCNWYTKRSIISKHILMQIIQNLSSFWAGLNKNGGGGVTICLLYTTYEHNFFCNHSLVRIVLANLLKRDCRAVVSRLTPIKFSCILKSLYGTFHDCFLIWKLSYAVNQMSLQQ